MIAHISSDGKEETVAEHTEKTKQLCEIKGKQCGIAEIMSLCAKLHDIGKEKQIFTDYLHMDEIERKKLKGSIAHASTGAKYIYDKLHSKNNINKKILVELISYCIAAHHGLFDCVDESRNDKFNEKISNVKDYTEACENAEREVLSNYNIEDSFDRAYEEFEVILNKIMNILKDNNEFFFYLSALERLMLSVLIDSDWEATSNFVNGKTIKDEKIDSKNVIFEHAYQNFNIYMGVLAENLSKAKRTKKEIRINLVRNEMQKECREFANHPSGIYCLPLPTGGGKTLSGLAYALEYCKKHKQTERIIYVSPFVSVTEQNADVFRDALGNNNWILEHHSSVVMNDHEESEDYKSEQLLQADINWEEPFICTTFVQFMNTLFSDKKQAIRRMHRLANSVVIIDEIQSMPIKCIDTFNCMVNFLNRVCNTDIILCTATQPRLAMTEHPICYSEPKNMIENVRKRFDDFDRVKIKYRKEKYTFDKLKTEIVQQMNCFDSILVVLNTKTAVQRLYDLLKENGIKVEYLTTNLCAEHRSEKIERIKRLLNKNQMQISKKEKIVVVSTNLIEAGVDISFECVYRSLAGLDSVAQTAGRCNRNGEREYGEVYLVDLQDEKIVCMKDLREARHTIKNVLDEYDGKNSLLLPDWLDEYFKGLYSIDDLKYQMKFPVKCKDTNIFNLLSTGFSCRDTTNILHQAYKTAGKMYKVIDDNSFEIIVPYKHSIEIIETLKGTTDIIEIKKCIRRAQRYTVSVNATQMKKLEGLIQPVSEYISEIYIPVSFGIYTDEYGITGELENLII